MKWERAVHHVETLAAACTDMATRPATIFPLRVTQLWVAGDILGTPGELDTVTVALAVDLPPDRVPWLTEPHGARHWGSAVRLSQQPLTVYWRSARAPVWNHRIERPALVWDSEGVRDDVLAALRDGKGGRVRTPAPDPGEFADRLAGERALSLAELRHRTGGYTEKRWSPGKLEAIADPLWQAAQGYLDLLEVARER